MSYGALPVTGNRGSSHRWSPGCAIALDDGLEKAGLLEFRFRHRVTAIDHSDGMVTGASGEILAGDDAPQGASTSREGIAVLIRSGRRGPQAVMRPLLQ